MKTLCGLDLLDRKWPKSLKGLRVGLLVHPASINRNFAHTSEIFHKSSLFKLTAFFGPQHGILGETQDNMIEWRGYKDPKTGLPIYSLYGETRKPYPSMLDGIDVMAIDMQDVGARYYTFIWTMELVMQACAELGRSVVILDRPNPIGGVAVEGTVLDEEYASFVGLRPLPIRHGMTIAEAALYLKDRYYPTLDLHIIKMRSYKRNMYFEETGLPWVLPSPNMPTVETAVVYPGMCLLEGTNLSEGRGTTRPFEIFGAPFILPEKLSKRLADFGLDGAVMRPIYFQPTFQKHAGKLCGGLQIHVLDRRKFKPFKTAIGILKAVAELYPEDFKWNPPPYEYETNKLPIDILFGNGWLRQEIENGEPLDRLEARWQAESRAFARAWRNKYLIYE